MNFLKINYTMDWERQTVGKFAEIDLKKRGAEVLYMTDEYDFPRSLGDLLGRILYIHSVCSKCLKSAHRWKIH